MDKTVSVTKTDKSQQMLHRITHQSYQPMFPFHKDILYSCKYLGSSFSDNHFNTFTLKLNHHPFHNPKETMSQLTLFIVSRAQGQGVDLKAVHLFI